MSRLKVGFIGAGGIFEAHAAELAQMHDVTIAGIAETHGARREQACRKYECVGYDDYRRLLDSDVDAVFVLTPPAFRRDHVIHACQASKHVFVEKPIALDLQTADDIIAAVQSAGVKCMVGFNYRFTPDTYTLGTLLHSGRLGDLVACWDEHHIFRTEASWRQQKASGTTWRFAFETCGGRMVEFGSHKVDWALWLGGAAKTVFGRVDCITEPIRPVDDTNLAVIGFERGFAKIEIVMTPCSLERRSLGILGTAGSGEVRDGKIIIRRKESERIEEAPITQPTSRQRHFIDCIINDRQPVQDAESGRRALEVCVAFYRSAETNSNVELPL
ncbi:MAG: Gfo/Idh/MocA family protein [Armatimonadota bacterium]